MNRTAKINRVAVAVVAGLGLLAGFAATPASAQINIGIRIGVPKPPVRERETVVVDYSSYHNGYRAALYDADWRLRVAQTEQWHAADVLEAARRREGEIAVVVDDQEELIAKYGKEAALGEAAVAEARARAAAFQKRVDSARSDLDAARTLQDSAGVADAQARIATNQVGVDKSLAELHAAEEMSAVRERLAVAQVELPRNRVALDAAHEDVFVARTRLDTATQDVALALHDRDEAMWMLYREDILAGRGDFAHTGFHVDLAVWGGRMPRDPEVVHAYFVHPVGYWVERPAEIQTRVIEVDAVPEIVRVREVQRSHEPRVREIEVIEREVPVERRRAYAEHVVVERQRLVAEKTERVAAAAEHRPVHINTEERAAAKAEVIQARGNAKTAEINAHANAKAEVTEAHADAKAKEIEAHADAKAKLTEAHADARAKETEAHADAKAKETEAHGDAKSKEIDAKAAARTEEINARTDAKDKASSASSSRSRGASSSDASRSPFGVGDSRGAASSARDSRGASSSNSNDPKKKKKDDGSTDSTSSGR